MESGYDIEGVTCIAESKNGRSLLMRCECEEFERDDSHEDADKCWIPKKVITDDSEVYEVKAKEEGTLSVAEWFAEKRGWL